MADQTDPLPADRGELLQSQWSIKWFTQEVIPPGQGLAPAELNTKPSRELSALTLCLNDLTFALECFTEADKLGRPDVANLHSKALLFSAVVAYARAFDLGVREMKLKPSFFEDLTQQFDQDLHQFLLDVRAKHVAHSVNEFEYCQTVAIMVGTPGSPSKAWTPKGLGFTETRAIGLGRQHVLQAITQLTAMIGTLRTMIESRQKEAFGEFKAQYEKDGKWKMAPIMRIPDRAKVRDKRPR